MLIIIVFWFSGSAYDNMVILKQEAQCAIASDDSFTRVSQMTNLSNFCSCISNPYVSLCIS